MEVSFPTDSEGFLSQECPSCGGRFKVLFGHGSEKPVSFCPYCRHNEQECWFTQEQVNHIQAVAADVVVAPGLREFERELSKGSTALVKVEATSSIPRCSIVPVETDDHFPVLRFPCCGETIKADRQRKLHCIICGGEIDMATIESAKIFLSHKGSDKNTVIDFVHTLKLLGYDPWLDEDAMPAGTALDRGILRGMQESCAVVFFMTPSFADEGYLETEINYAIQEKRARGDRFAIVTLRLADGDGKTATVPDLLKSYVWKTPRTRLEALREIVRALPVTVGRVQWRDNVTESAIASTTTPKSDDLSSEAQAILWNAVAGDGYVLRTSTFGGEHIQADGRAIIPDDDDPRTVAHWIGGLEDLQRRRYIKDVGNKGEVFRVTREGYEAADRIPRPGQPG